MNCFHAIWPHVKAAFAATYVSIEIAAVGAFIGLQQLRYYKKQDAILDARNQWEKVHKAMMEFRFRRGVLVMPRLIGQTGIYPENVVEAAHSLHMLRGELDRAPDSPLVAQIAELLNANPSPEQWRADEFAPKFDKLAHEAALKSR